MSSGAPIRCGEQKFRLGGVETLPNNAYTNDGAKKLQQNCLDNFNNSGGVAVVNFFSLASTFIGPDRLNSAIEDVGGTGLNFAAYSFFKTASTSMVRTPFGSMSGLVAGTIETVARGCSGSG